MPPNGWTIRSMNKLRWTSQHRHGGPTLAEIEALLRADRHSQDEIDLSLALLVIVQEELARRGKWPPPKREYQS